MSNYPPIDLAPGDPGHIGHHEILHASKNVTAHPAAGATETFDPETELHTVTLTANCTATFAAPDTDVAEITLQITQDGTGGWTMTWPASVAWAAGVAPTLSTGAAAVDWVAFLTIDGGTRWDGFVASLDSQ